MITENDTFVLLDDRTSADSPCSLYTGLVEVVRADTPAQVDDALARIDNAKDQGLHAAGFMAYELGQLLEPTLKENWSENPSVPLIWFGLFSKKEIFSAREYAERFLNGDDATYEVNNLNPSVSRERYLSDVKRVRDYIAAGDVYQINYTFNLHFDFSGNPLALYDDLRRKQHAGHGAVIWAPDFRILSASPEQFLKIDGERIETRPMKGTASRGTTVENDRKAGAFLTTDEKSQAENLMIVDLLRNDIGKIATIGSVKVHDLFKVETYPTVHQMTTMVEATLKPDTSIETIITKTFPCGSITGAPKIRAMEIIHELEGEKRGVYTGSIGAFDADGSIHLNVAIRTVQLYGQGFSKGVLGIGSGIVYDSRAEDEYEECLLKARFLTAPPHRFQVLETMRWHRDTGIDLFDEHVTRMASTAKYFGYGFDEQEIKSQVLAHLDQQTLPCLRLRVLLDEFSNVEVQSFELQEGTGEPLRCVLWPHALDSSDPFLYHKTTKRDFYDEPFADVSERGIAEEVLFINENGYITEASRTNVFVQIGGELLTPPIDDGVLAGTLRQQVLEAGVYDGMVVREASLTPSDLEKADNLYLCNSVRGMQRAIYAGVLELS